MNTNNLLRNSKSSEKPPKTLLKKAGLKKNKFQLSLHSVRAKITIPYLLLGLLIAITVSVTAFKIVVENIDERFNNQLYEARLIASGEMVQEERRLLETLRLIANTKGVAEAIVAQDAEKLRELSIGIAVNNEEERIEFLDTNGLVLLAMQQRTGSRREEYVSTIGGAIVHRDWPFVQAVLEGKSDEYGNKYSGYAQAPWGNLFYVVGPVLDSNNTQIGTILIGKSLETLAFQIRAKILGHVSFYDLDGIPLDSTLPEGTGPISESVVQETLANQDNSSYRSNAGDRETHFESLTYSELLGPWEIRSKADIGIMGVTIAKNMLITASIPARLTIIVLAAATIFFIAIIGIDLSKRISTPILDLVHASKEVSSGNLNIRVTPQSKDEIELLGLNFNQMVASLDESQRELIGAYDTTLEGWCMALELRDHETEGHTLRVTNNMVNLSRAYGLSEDEIVQIRRGSLLHDIGKMGIPDEILRKAGPLTDEEWEIMKQHPQMAYDMLKSIDFLAPALEIPYYHHEQWDGKGYPNGLKGTEIPLVARLFSIIDSWDALLSNRPYRNAMSSATTLETIISEKGTRFDPELVDFFLAFIQKNEQP